MKIQQKKFSKSTGWENLKNNSFDASSCNFVLAFGSTSILEDAAIYQNIGENYPNSDIIINSTTGEIYDIEVNDDTVSLTAVCFEQTTIKTVTTHIDDMKNSREAGKALASPLSAEKLANVLVISVGLKVNGDELVEGLRECLPEKIEVVRAQFGTETALTGFYSYGEISPTSKSIKCALHNQTMTITTFSENE